MNVSGFGSLVQTTLRDPRTAAQTIMAENLPRDMLWTALALVAAINAIILHLLIAASPPEAQAQFPGYFNMPLAVFLLLAGIMVIYVHALYWAGVAVSGQGRLDDMLALIVWLQVLRTGVQLLIFALTFVVPTLAGVISLVAFAWGVWILLWFVSAAMQLKSLGRAFLVLALAVLGLIIGVGILLAIIGFLAQGTLSNV